MILNNEFSAILILVSCCFTFFLGVVVGIWDDKKKKEQENKERIEENFKRLKSATEENPLPRLQENGNKYDKKVIIDINFEDHTINAEFGTGDD